MLETNDIQNNREAGADTLSGAELQKLYTERLRKYVEEHLKGVSGEAPTCHVVTFGCQMNARDSEKLLGVLLAAGFKETDTEDADFVIFNTCTVRDNADQRLLGRLGALKAFKKKNPSMKIALCGCMMQESTNVEKIRTSYPQVDLIFGTHNIYKFPELLFKAYETGNRIIDIWQEADNIVEDLPTSLKYPFKSGVNIMFGCNNFCSYCIVPYVRGRERSRRPGEILTEIRKLVENGVREVMLLGQNVNSYGLSFHDGDQVSVESTTGMPVDFPSLLKEVEKIEGLERIRFMTSHPKDLSPELIRVIKESKKICRHLHLPLQSGSDRILKAMNRRYTKADYMKLVDSLYAAMPDLYITTDIIVGFPGENAADVEETMEVIRHCHFANAFTFIYSPRAGTPAAALAKRLELRAGGKENVDIPDEIRGKIPGEEAFEFVPEKDVKANFDRVLKLVQETARERVSGLENTVASVLVEEENTQTEGFVTGRMGNNTLVHFPGDKSMIGQIMNVELLENHGFYYMGRSL